MLKVFDGGPSRPTQTDLENILVWRNGIERLQGHLDRVAPKVLAAVEKDGPDVVEPGPNVAVAEPVVEV